MRGQKPGVLYHPGFPGFDVRRDFEFVFDNGVDVHLGAPPGPAGPPRRIDVWLSSDSSTEGGDEAVCGGEGGGVGWMGERRFYVKSSLDKASIKFRQGVIKFRRGLYQV